MKYHYRMRLRPASIATLPPGLVWEFVEMPPDLAHLRPDLPRSAHPFRVISTSRPLTRDELERYDIDVHTSEPSGTNLSATAQSPHAAKVTGARPRKRAKRSAQPPSPADEHVLAYSYRGAVCNVLYDPFAQSGAAREERLAAVARMRDLLTQRGFPIPALNAGAGFVNPRYLDEIAERLYANGVWERPAPGRPPLIGSADSRGERFPRRMANTLPRPVLLARYFCQHARKRLTTEQLRDPQEPVYDVMLAAWRDLTTLVPDFFIAEHARVWAEAWQLAKAADFDWNAIL